MSQKPKIVLIGAGSVSFGLSSIRDAFSMQELWGSTLVFVDIDQKALDATVTAAERMNRELGAGYTIQKTTDRREVLPGADFVVVSIAINRAALWKMDFEIPQKHGIRHVLGENGGPGSIFHTMRNIGPMLEIGRDVEELCPEALLINFTNPESRMIFALSRFTNVKAVGLCHQIEHGKHMISEILNRPAEELTVRAYGLNHFTWFKEIMDKKTGEDLYPLVAEREKSFDPAFEPFTRYMYHRFGLFPTAGDGHLGEYLPYAHEMITQVGFDYEKDRRYRQTTYEHILRIGSGEIDITKPVDFGDGPFSLLKPSGERGFDIIRAMVTGKEMQLDAVNIRNDGFIENLPDDAVVEVPAVVDGSGIHGLRMGELPLGIAALCQTQIAVQRVNIEAGALGNRGLAIQALLADPNVPSAEAAEKLFAELMEINLPYLPQFQR